MRIAVYTIAKDEEAHVQRWAESSADADYRLILDTGSTDDTVGIAAKFGITVVSAVFDPWRFDNARNVALDLLPDDIDMCIALDMDEVLAPGWRSKLEALEVGVTRPRYKYTWSWERPGVPGLQYGGDKIHARHGYIWKHPVHEVITPTGEERQAWCGLEIHHHPDGGKSRGGYAPLLALAVEEDPDDDRNAHYYARELFFAGRHAEAEREFERHLSLPSAVWGPERAQSCRYLFKITGNEGWLDQAIEEAPERREAYVDRAWLAYLHNDWPACFRDARAALAIGERPLEYLTEEFAWGSLPHDLAAVAAHCLGYNHEALHHGMQALRLSPYDQRIVDNARMLKEAAA